MLRGVLYPCTGMRRQVCDGHNAPDIEQKLLKDLSAYMEAHGASLASGWQATVQLKQHAGSPRFDAQFISPTGAHSSMPAH